MSTITATRRLEFDAAHRVLRHESKCRHLHGHRYKVDLTVGAPELDALGRVVDFGCVKQIVGKWIDDNWDHNILLHPNDPILDCFPPATDDESERMMGGEQQQLASMFGGKPPYLFPAGTNPTAENIAAELHRIASRLLRQHDGALLVTRVRVWETPNCYADFTP